MANINKGMVLALACAALLISAASDKDVAAASDKGSVAGIGLYLMFLASAAGSIGAISRAASRWSRCS